MPMIDLEQIRSPLLMVLAAIALTSVPGASWGERPSDLEGSSIEDPSQLKEWAQGPVRWLLLPAEIREIERVSSPAEARGFIERFWARRDPDPAVPGNPFRENFSRLVEASDLLYPDEEVRGSMTARGRGLILLGSPTGLRVSSQEALEWDPATAANENVRVRYLPLEIWTYQLEDFPRALRLALKALGDETTYRLTFVRDPEGTTLSEGEELLELAARTALALP